LLTIGNPQGANITIARRSISAYLPETRLTYAVCLTAMISDQYGAAVLALRGHDLGSAAGSLATWAFAPFRRDGGKRHWKIMIGREFTS